LTSSSLAQQPKQKCACLLDFSAPADEKDKMKEGSMRQIDR